MNRYVIGKAKMTRGKCFVCKHNTLGTITDETYERMRDDFALTNEEADRWGVEMDRYKIKAYYPWTLLCFTCTSAWQDEHGNAVPTPGTLRMWRVKMDGGNKKQTEKTNASNGKEQRQDALGF